ncbi:hypothetical protein OS493_032130 [Desmophyllum pertusum]|uniref:Uncharacterized protein n=1 Tax=Desmophyllum pertusum TaxID=174260 RepID=A0A9X0CKE5_9CNID|nr:hypothetical protein OS493_032130 [Desmophyllum pertusum]
MEALPFFLVALLALCMMPSACQVLTSSMPNATCTSTCCAGDMCNQMANGTITPTATAAVGSVSLIYNSTWVRTMEPPSAGTAITATFGAIFLVFVTALLALLG